ncbi:hypothetical protein SH584_11495 [Sphingomonas sp. LY29]|uniref:hypothetical protein n=1 Tax=Sphingomonas sp. LY29 TaxID=3095341 RepID=UPI002D77F292|nr:hypothetical protein [Sphingomonas sp. LY29]WRP25656.1 hypothetical protein SH584_11495 [Sphingomonas sp. LY29]
MKLAWGDFLPDLPNHGTPGVAEAVNLYPSSGGYRPVGQWVAHTEALPSLCKGSAAFVAPSGRVSIIAGTATNIYRQNGLAWDDIGGGFSLAEEDRWRFVQFGKYALATNSVDAIYKVDLELDEVTLLSLTAPIFEALAVVNNFVVGTKMDGVVNQLAWSGENNAEWWTFAQRKSDFQEFADGGEITGIIGGEIGLILQRSAVRRMAYVGGNVLFRFDKISANVGCASIHSVAQHGDLAFWHSDSGFQMWDGAQIRPIGFEKVDSAFASLYGQINYAEMSTATDGQRNTVCWSTGNKMWIYNWVLDKWSIIDFPASIVTSRITRAPGLEEQDPAIGVEDDNVDAPDLDSFDSGRFVGGDPLFYVFQEGTIGTFSGDNMAAKIVGRSVEMIEGRDARIRRVRPMTDATDGITVRLDTRQRLGDMGTRRDFTTLQASGEMPVRARGRFVEPRLMIAAGEPWTYLQGIDATLAVGGRR